MRAKVATAEEAELLRAEKAKAYAFVDTGLRPVTTRLTQGNMVHVELALHRLHEQQYLNFDVPAEADQLVRAVDWFIKNYRAPVENMPTVKSFVPLFLKAKEAMAPATHQDYKKNLEKFAEPPYGDLRLDQITTKHVADFIESKKVGRTTKAKYFGAIRALLYFASSKSEFVETPWISHNPAVDMLHPPKPSVPRRQRYTLDEVRRLIQVSIYLR